MTVSPMMPGQRAQQKPRKIEFLRQRRVGSIWHVKRRIIADTLETFCPALFKVGSCERSPERPDPKDTCTRCTEALAALEAST